MLNLLIHRVLVNFVNFLCMIYARKNNIKYKKGLKKIYEINENVLSY